MIWAQIHRGGKLHLALEAGEECPHHPGEKVGAFGCPACNAGRRWRERGQIAKVTIGSRP